MKTQDIHEKTQQEIDEQAADQSTTKESLSEENGQQKEAGDQVASQLSEVDQLKTKIEELNDKYLRQVADFENFKRRNAKERMELIQTAGRDVITSLLDVLDDSERAQNQLDKTDDVSQIKEGILLVFNKLRSNLYSKGLKPMDAKGKDFDPDLHEAITEIEAGEKMKGKVIDEVQKGYYLNDKIIRYAKVVVGK